MVVFESADCNKCQLLRAMLKAPVLQPYLQQMEVAFINSSDTQRLITTPEGRQRNGKTWTDELGLINSPAMVFFEEQGKEAVRVDTDILLDLHGKTVEANNEHTLNNIRARMRFVLEKGYVSLPQFQRWRKQQRINAKKPEPLNM